MRSTLAIAVALAALAGTAHAAPRPEQRFVIIVGNNASVTPGTAPLSYADDDAARWYELLAPTAREISVFTVLDTDSQRLFRDVARVAESPTRAGLMARLSDYNRKMQAARAEGNEPVLLFVFVGHGEIAPDGEGYVSLLDAPLRRGDLFREVIAPSQASFNHLIIDTCNSYLMIARRGGGERRGPDASAAIHGYIADEDLARHPNTGVLLSTASAQATHEWSEYRGGVFSHEVLSALAGAADVNGDGRVEYSELEAFVAAANLRVDDPRARLQIFAAAPALDRGRAMIDLAASRMQHFLVLPTEAQGHYYLEDARGVRYADFNKAPERSMIIALVDSAYYYLRSDEGEAQLKLDRPGALRLPTDGWRRRTLAARGSLADSLERHLFEVPFGPSFYRGYAANTGELTVAEAQQRFLPPMVDDVERSALQQRLGALHVSASDTFAQSLVKWAARRIERGDFSEAERTLRAIEARSKK